ncbi:MAG: pal [Nitrospirae bacterium]|nr:pal [Nitrospirota bacterium]
MNKGIVCILLICGLFFTGCSQRKVAPQVKPDEQQLEQQQQASDAAAREKKGALKPDERVTEQQLAKIETKEEPARFKEESGLFEDIYFDFDMYDIRSDAKPVLHDVSSWLLKNPAARLSVEGHCDERGTNEKRSPSAWNRQRNAGQRTEEHILLSYDKRAITVNKDTMKNQFFLHLCCLLLTLGWLLSGCATTQDVDMLRTDVNKLLTESYAAKSDIDGLKEISILSKRR